MNLLNAIKKSLKEKKPIKRKAWRLTTYKNTWVIAKGEYLYFWPAGDSAFIATLEDTLANDWIVKED